jgi:hypothetical protein
VEADAVDGHKRIDETMLYIQLAAVHMRPVPAVILAAGRGNDDPDRQIVATLSARQAAPVSDPHCSKSSAARSARESA